jgi:hypothetical protein
MGGILITHCKEDGPLAEDLRSQLAVLAVPDPYEFVSLTSGLSEKPLRVEMTAAAALVALLSEHARRDARVVTEAGLAVSLGKPVIAVITDATKPESLDFIEAQAWIQAALTESREHLAREIHQALRRE